MENIQNGQFVNPDSFVELSRFQYPYPYWIFRCICHPNSAGLTPSRFDYVLNKFAQFLAKKMSEANPRFVKIRAIRGKKMSEANPSKEKFVKFVAIKIRTIRGKQVERSETQIKKALRK